MQDMQNICIRYFEVITHRTYDSSNPSHVACITLMEQEMENKKGNEGLQAFSANGISETYLNGFSSTVQQMLDKLSKKVKFF